MNPVIKRLQANFLLPTLTGDSQPLSIDFKKLDSEFFSKVIAHHPILNLEYSVLRQQINKKLSASAAEIDQEKLIEQLKAALLIARLMEYLFHHYLGVPREVQRLKQHQQVYKELLKEAGQEVESRLLEATAEAADDDASDVGFSLSQKIRETTLHKNGYRLLLVRTKRLLDLIFIVGANSERFKHFVLAMDKFADPIIPYLAWCFLTPRMLTNLFLLAKHSIPGFWMNEEEKSIAWQTRLQGQLQRRWFELGNDVIWVAVGIINCFLLIGPLAPIGAYLSLAFFAYDVVLAAIRAYIELNRIDQLLQEYDTQLKQEISDVDRQDILDLKNNLIERQYFEKMRLGFNVFTTLVIFLGMCLAIPALSAIPVIPLIGAIILVGITLTGFILSARIEQQRPIEEVKKASGITALGIFSKSKTSIQMDNLKPNQELDPRLELNQA